MKISHTAFAVGALLAALAAVAYAMHFSAWDSLQNTFLALVVALVMRPTRGNRGHEVLSSVRNEAS
jgi:hypothetical protein